MKRKYWTEEECTILKNNYKNPINWSTLLKLLPDRNKETVYKKAQALNLNPYDYCYTGTQGYLIKGERRNRSIKKYLHRVVYENHYNVTLTSYDIIHHIDGDKTNNEISNLQRMTRAEHCKHHHAKLLSARRSKMI